MRRTILLVAMLCTVGLAPTATADHVSEVERYEDTYVVTEAHADGGDANRLLFDATCELIFPICQEPHYGSEAKVEIWEETNGCEDLQRRQIDCDGDGSYNEADTHVQTIGCESGGTDPCGQTSVI